MAQPYHDQLSKMIDPLLSELEAEMDIECTHFFEGAAVYVNGEICMSLTPNGLAIKLPDAEYKKVRDLGGDLLRLFPSGPIKKNYVVIPATIMNSNVDLALWLRRCVEAAAKNTAPEA